MSGYDANGSLHGNDGRFEHQHRDEGDVDDLTRPLPLDDVVPAGGMVTISEDELPGYFDFDSVDVTRNDDGTFAIQANAGTDVQYGLAKAYADERGWDIDNFADADAAVEADLTVNAWLARHSEDAIAWFEDATGSRLHREFEWDNQRFSWDTTMPAGSTTDQVVEVAEEAVGTHPDTDDGFYARMWSEAEGYRARNSDSD